MKIGVLAMQGAFREHIHSLERCGAQTVEIRQKEQVADIDGLVIPGGESTSIYKLMNDCDLVDIVRTRALNGLPVFGTCAGMVLLAKKVKGRVQPTLQLMDVTVERNAFGRQRDSFEADLEIDEVGREPFRAVFIRAPFLTEWGRGVGVMAQTGGHPVLVREKWFLAAAFHPELTRDLRLHQFFLEMVSSPDQQLNSC